MDRPRRFERIGHRGAPKELPENTLPSFERALERGAEALELDVHATSDGVVIVHHDPVLPPGTLPRQLARAPIVSTSWADLKEAEVAPAARIPRLEDVLAMAGGHATVYVEIKGRDIELLVAETLQRAACVCAVHSFEHRAIERMRSIAPEIPRGLLFERYPRDLSESMARADARDVWPKWSLIDRALVEAAHRAGGRVIAWTVNDGSEAERLVGLGVDGICSDDLRQIR
jgi:glycerophosphoryl diester phosphodiesterase